MLFENLWNGVFLGDMKMESQIKVVVTFCLIGLLVSLGIGQGAVGGKSEETSGGGREGVPSLPYLAKITGDNVNIRSGPGTNYYGCGKVDKGDRVKVVGSKFSWSQIVPPAGSFSWISKQYVRIDLNEPSMGIVAGDAVRVYAGSARVKPIHSTTVQLKFKRGDKVKLLGEEAGDYYKIAPPEGAYLWVSTEYTEAVGDIEAAAAAVEPSPEAVVEERPVVVPTNLGLESRKLKEYYALEKRIQAERAKARAEQDYGDMKRSLGAIAEMKGTGKAARYSKFALKQIGRYELAVAVDKELELQDAQLERIAERIEKAHAARLAQVPNVGKFAVMGRFEVSNIYEQAARPRHYRITDDGGRTVCYAVAARATSETDLSKFVGQKVGLVGSIEPYPQTKSALVRFVEIEALE
jgi:hypothetical protein